MNTLLQNDGFARPSSSRLLTRERRYILEDGPLVKCRGVPHQRLVLVQTQRLQSRNDQVTPRRVQGSHLPWADPSSTPRGNHPLLPASKRSAIPLPKPPSHTLPPSHRLPKHPLPPADLGPNLS